MYFPLRWFFVADIYMEDLHLISPKLSDILQTAVWKNSQSTSCKSLVEYHNRLFVDNL